MSKVVKRKGYTGLVGLVFLTSLLLGGCTGLSPEEVDAQAEQIAVPIVATWKAGAPTPTARPTRTPTPAPATESTRVPPPKEMDLAPSQVLHLSACCAGSDFSSIDPVRAWGGDPAQVVSEAFVGLTRQNEETSEIEAGMATTWQISDDRLVWTFQLRTDVPWVRYNPATERVEQVTDEGDQVRYVTAYDFEYGIKRALDPETGSYDAPTLYIIEGAEEYHTDEGPSSAIGIRALDEATLEIQLTRPAAYLDVIADKWIMVAQPEWQIEAWDEAWTEPENFQGYGPYVLKDWVHDSHLTLVQNPFWPGTDSIPQPTIEEITWTLMDREEALHVYQAGDLDAVGLVKDTLPVAMADPQLADQLVTQPRMCTYYYGFNVRKPPFDDPQVRLAFSLAIDQEAVVAGVTGENHQPAYWFSQPGLRAAPTVEDHPTLGVGYDPDQARALLDEVYPDRSLMPQVTLGLPNFSHHEVIAEAIRGMWADVLDVDVDLEPTDNYLDYLDLLKTDAPPIWQSGWCAYYPDAHSPLGDLFSIGVPDRSTTNWSSGAFDELIDMGATSTDTAQRTEWYAQVENILVREEAAIIPIYWYTNSGLTQPTIHRTYSQINGVERFEKWAVLKRE